MVFILQGLKWRVSESRCIRDDDGGKISQTKGVFLVKTNNAFVPVKRDNSVNTYSRFSTVPQGSERSE